MSLVNLAHVCSHLQNASKARLGLTSVPHTNLHLDLALVLQKQGFFSTVILGGPNPPTPAHLLRRSEPANYHHLTDDQLAASPWLAYPTARHNSFEPRADRVPENPAKRRLWLGLKYWNGGPVLSRMNMISKPSHRIWLDSRALATIAMGRDAGHVAGLKRIGECIVVSTDKGIMEIRECVEKKIGGQLLCRVL